MAETVVKENSCEGCCSCLQNKISEYNPDDKISELPDEILAEIVRRLPLKEAAATSIVSRRWRYVWTSATNLDFDGDKNTVHRMCSHSYVKQKWPKRHKFINWVNTVINQHNGGYIERFRIYYDLSSTCASSLNKWVKFAVQKRVQILELQLLELRGRRGTSTPYEFLPSSINNINNISNNDFKYLKVLRLVCVQVCDEVLESLLCNCPVLERLKVVDSDLLINLRVVGPSLALKHLNLRHCDNLESLEICDALNLVSFCCHMSRMDGPPLRLVIRNAPKLVDVYIYSFHSPYLPRTFTALSCCVSQLQILQLRIYYLVETVAYPMLTNLKELKLILNGEDNKILLHIPPFLEKAPNLQRLVLKIEQWSYTQPKMKTGEICKPANCPHLCLKEVEILGYSGLPNDDELIIYLMKIAVSLEKIIVNACEFLEWPFKLRRKTTETRKKEKEARYHAKKHIKKMIPKTIQFICL